VDIRDIEGVDKNDDMEDRMHRVDRGILDKTMDRRKVHKEHGWRWWWSIGIHPTTP
jgi:hypothetical protein